MGQLARDSNSLIQIQYACVYRGLRLVVIMQTIFDAVHEKESARVHKYTIIVNGKPVSYADALDLWLEDTVFCSLFISLLSEVPFTAYRWGTPPITKSTVTRDFEFIIVNSPALDRAPDRQAFSGHFTKNDCNNGIVVFENLGKDATLVVPSPRGLRPAYAHLAAFVRGAPDAQKHALWQVVGQTVKQTLSERPLWISTAGGGIAWLHVRLDSWPKYYAHAPYKYPYSMSARRTDGFQRPPAFNA